MKRFPESKNDVIERAGIFTETFQELYSEPGLKTLHVIVAHGTPIRMFSQQHGGKKKKI